jgi:uncharacterized membrane protein YvlD (DUF360 family)
MKRLFWYWLISSAALVLTASTLHNGVKIDPWYNALWIAPLLGLVNAVVGALSGVVSWIALPNLLTLGCFSFILSFIGYIIAIQMLADKLKSLFQVENLMWAAALAIVMSLFSTLLNMVLPWKAARRR